MAGSSVGGRDSFPILNRATNPYLHHSSPPYRLSRHTHTNDNAATPASC